MDEEATMEAGQTSRSQEAAGSASRASGATPAQHPEPDQSEEYGAAPLKLPFHVAVYVGVIIAAGLAATAHSLSQWTTTDPLQFVC